jgi:hypothetical protein
MTSMKKKVVLTIDLPIDKEHGAIKGAIFDLLEESRGRYWFSGATGVKCAAWPGECEIIDASGGKGVDRP